MKKVKLLLDTFETQDHNALMQTSNNPKGGDSAPQSQYPNRSLEQEMERCRAEAAAMALYGLGRVEVGVGPSVTAETMRIQAAREGTQKAARRSRGEEEEDNW